MREIILSQQTAIMRNRSCPREVFAAILLIAAALGVGQAAGGQLNPGPEAPRVVSLDGAAEWRVAVDPANIGREEKWWEQPRTDAKPVRVPGVYQEVWPGCHGAAWY